MPPKKMQLHSRSKNSVVHKREVATVDFESIVKKTRDGGQPIKAMTLALHKD